MTRVGALWIGGVRKLSVGMRNEVFSFYAAFYFPAGALHGRGLSEQCHDSDGPGWSGLNQSK